MNEALKATDPNRIKAVIFDYGRTLHDKEKNAFFPEVEDVLGYLFTKYKLAIVSVARGEPAEERIAALKMAGLSKYFSSMMFHETVDKDLLFRDTLNKLRVLPKETAVVDDRVQRGIIWGNKNGALTIWFQNGKFSDELPNEETGMPSYVIKNLAELKRIL